MLRILLLATLALLMITGCSEKIGNLFTVYKIDVQQGNALEQKKVEELRVGMSKEQVRFLLGTPLVQDVFHPDRWDYVYDFIPGYGERERRHIAVFFNGDSVAEIVRSEGDVAYEDEVVECGFFSRWWRSECAR
jgi:outer membrane protein assembly factor BamE